MPFRWFVGFSDWALDFICKSTSGDTEDFFIRDYLLKARINKDLNVATSPDQFIESQCKNYPLLISQSEGSVSLAHMACLAKINELNINLKRPGSQSVFKATAVYEGRDENYQYKGSLYLSRFQRFCYILCDMLSSTPSLKHH